MATTDQSLLGDMKMGDILNYLEERLGVAFQLPAVPSSNGTYFLQVVKSNTGATFSWQTVSSGS